MKSPNTALFVHILKTYVKTIKTSHKVFPIYTTLFYIVKIPAKLLFVHLCCLCDSLFYRKYKSISVEKPIFIVGHPRSATSFFHALLSSSNEFLFFSNWEIFNPSLVAKKMFSGSRTLQLLSSFICDFRYTPHRIFTEGRKSRGKVRTVIKERKDTSVMTGKLEEELLFLNVLDTQFLAVDTPLGFSNEGFDEICYADDQQHQSASVAFFKSCIQKQSYFTGKKQLIAKMNFSLFRLNSIKKCYPDAKFIFLLRSPLDTINSHLSAQREALKMQYGEENISERAMKLFIESRYKYNISFYKRLVEVLDNDEVDPDKFIVIRYQDIKNDLSGVISRFKEFTELSISSELENSILEADKQQATYRREHTNLPLESFGLTQEQIKTDFSFYFEKFGSDEI